MVTGQITQVAPDQIRPGDPIKIYVSYKAISTEGWHQWRTRLVAISGNLKEWNTDYHFGKEGHRDREGLNLGIMVDYPIQIDITLEGFDSPLYGEWKIVDQRTLIIKPGAYQAIKPVPIAVDIPGTQDQDIIPGGNDRTVPVDYSIPGTSPSSPGWTEKSPSAGLGLKIDSKWLWGGALVLGFLILLPGKRKG